MCHFCHTLRFNRSARAHTKVDCYSSRNPWSNYFDPRNINNPDTLYALRNPPPDGMLPVAAARGMNNAPRPAVVVHHTPRHAVVAAHHAPPPAIMMAPHNGGMRPAVAMAPMVHHAPRHHAVMMAPMVHHAPRHHAVVAMVPVMNSRGQPIGMMPISRP